ncbi:MAG: hypothetical protein HY360_16650 [Verrucomicrobia bacterium]|nr:hypothetical protein [Verrucomicrobiota bacterium]
MNMTSHSFRPQKRIRYQGFILLVALAAFPSLGMCQADQGLEMFKQITGVLLNREQVIQTAVLECESTVIINEKGAPFISFTKGLEKYKLNRAYSKSREFHHREGKESPVKPNWSLEKYWNGASSFLWNMKENRATIKGSKDVRIASIDSFFYEISFIVPRVSFRMEFTDPYDQGATPYFIQLTKRLPIMDPAYTKGFNEGELTLKNIGNSIWRFAAQERIFKKPTYISEFDEKHGFSPIKDEVYENRIEGDKTVSRLCSEWMATDLHEVIPGIYFPYHVKLTSYSCEEDKQRVTSSTEINVKRLEVNVKIDDSEFTPKFPEGTEISDQQKGVAYTVEEDQK